MAMLSPTELLAWLGQNQFLSPAQVDELRPQLSGFPETHALAKELIRRDWLTPYQINQIVQGKHDQLVLGNYRLRERIGEGAMGQVFKAWNLRMASIVAVKTIHKELVNSSKAMDRFRARGRNRRPARSSQHRSGPRCRRGGGPPLPRHGFHRRLQPGPPRQAAGTAADSRGRRVRPPGGTGPAARARTRHRPSRHQAEQPHRHGPQGGRGGCRS